MALLQGCRRARRRDPPKDLRDRFSASMKFRDGRNPPYVPLRTLLRHDIDRHPITSASSELQNAIVIRAVAPKLAAAAPEDADLISLRLRAAADLTSRHPRDSNHLNSRPRKAGAFARTSASQCRTDLARSCSSRIPCCAPQSLVCSSPCRGAPDTKKKWIVRQRGKRIRLIFLQAAVRCPEHTIKSAAPRLFQGGFPLSLDSGANSQRRFKNLETLLSQFPRVLTQKTRGMTRFPRVLSQNPREMTRFPR